MKYHTPLLLVVVILLPTVNCIDKRWGVFNNKAIRQMLKDCLKIFAENKIEPLPCYNIVFDNDYFWTK